MALREADLRRVISSLLKAELSAFRVASNQPAMFSPDTRIGDGGLGADSLELVTLATAVAEMFHLHDAGVQEYLIRYRTVGEWTEMAQFALSRGSQRITFRTSGSTGAPVACTHSLDDLAQEAAFLAERFPGARGIVTLVPAHHIYGFLFTAMLPAVLDIDVSAGALPPDWSAGNLLVGAPFHWAAIARTAPEFPPGAAGVFSGGPCNQAVLSELHRKGLTLTDVYGSSQTAGIGYRQGPDPEFRLFPYWSRSRERPETALVRNGEREYELQDRLEWSSQETFRVAGRRDGMVQVAGLNVSPEAIADRIRTHPLVADCAVRLMRPEEGDRLKAFIVWRDDVEVSTGHAAAFERWLRTGFRSHERPARIDSGARIPRNPLGKPRDWTCRE